MIYWIPFAIASVIVAAFVHSRQKSREQDLREERLRKFNPVENFELNLVNTSLERSTIVSRNNNTIRIETDIERITVLNNTLEIQVLSQIELVRFELTMNISPFDYKLVTSESPIHDKLVRSINIKGHGTDSAMLIEYLNHLLELDLSLELAMAYYELKLLSIQSKEYSQALQCYCIGGADIEIDITIDNRAKKLIFEIPLSLLVQNQIKKLI